MIFDAFLFFDELKILKLRLEELCDVVDFCVLVESPHTFSNRPKPLYFQEHRALFAKYERKIRHVIVEDMPKRHESAWDVEEFQRNAIMRGLTEANPDDLIIISDVDEIPRHDVIKSFNSEFAALELEYFYYKLNCKSLAHKWIAPAVLQRKSLTTPQEARLRAFYYWKHSTSVVSNAGWHFSCMQDPAGISLKLQSFSHQEYNHPRFTDPEAIAYRMRYGLDLVGRRKFFWCCVPFDESFPKYVIEHREEFQEMIADFAQFHIDREKLIYHLEDELARTSEALAAKTIQGERLVETLGAFEHSRSWRATAPLRALVSSIVKLGALVRKRGACLKQSQASRPEGHQQASGRNTDLS